MDWKLIFELFLQYGPQVLKIILDLINKAPADRATAAKNFGAIFLAATKQNDWKGMMAAQVCGCAMSLSDQAFADFKAGLESVASEMEAVGAALRTAK